MIGSKEQENNAGIYFPADVGELLRHSLEGDILHILCQRGELSFNIQGKPFTAHATDLIIIPEPETIDSMEPSSGYEGLMLCLTNAFATEKAVDNDFTLIGMMSLMLNPIVRLDAEDYAICLHDMLRLRERFLLQPFHHFRRQMLESMMSTLILNIHDIMVRSMNSRNIPDNAARIMGGFVRMLREGDYRDHRNVGHYASKLFVTDNYLTEISRLISGHPATFWINLFAANEIARLLKHSRLSLTEIADRFHFSSMPYFTRYVAKRLGKTPAELRK